jgi:hypothetical protein
MREYPCLVDRREITDARFVRPTLLYECAIAAELAHIYATHWRNGDLGARQE